MIRWIPFITVAVATTLLFYLALHRFVAADEGFYLVAAKSVSFGRIPYLDFFYPQMPLLPYLYGGVLSVFGFTWDVARSFAAFLSVLSVALLYIRLRLYSVPITMIGIALLLSSGLVLAWYPTAKTFSLATVFVLASYLFTVKPPGITLRLAPLLAGFALGLAVNTRLFYASVIPLFLFDLWRKAHKQDRQPFTDPLLFLVGGAITALPHLFFLIQDFDSYWFNNLGYHLVRSHRPLELDLISRGNIYAVLFRFQSDSRLDGIQLPLLFYGALTYLLFCIIKRRPPDLAVQIGLVLFAVSLTPNPIHFQYFAATVPFFIIAVCELLKIVHESLTVRPNKVIIGTSLLVGLTLFCEYVRHLPAAVYRLTESGDGVKGIEPEHRHLARIATVQEVSQRLNSYVESGEHVLSQWPGHLFESRASVYPGMENQFWVRISHKLGQPERRKYHLFTREEIWSELENPNLRVVVIEKHKMRRYFPRKKLEKAGFQIRENIGTVLLWIKTDGNDSRF